MPLTKEEVIKRPWSRRRARSSRTPRTRTPSRSNKKADKTQIKNAIETLYNVRVLHVRTVQVAGKPRRTRTGYTTTSAWKKAVVKLHPDHKIDLF